MSAQTRRLVLLRHAKSDRPAGVPDHGRPLAERGRRDAGAVGRWLAEHDLVPDLVLCSDAARAVQTWEAAAAALDAEVPARYEPGLYDVSAAAVVAIAAEVPDDVRTLLLVGHEPTTSAVAEALAGPGSDEALVAQVRAHLPTSGVVVLETDRLWRDLQGASCRLVDVAAPRG